MTRLLWLAVGSQLPFALTFQPGVSASFHIDLSFVSMALAGCALLFYLLGRNMGLSFWAALFSAALLPALRWTQNGVILLAPPLNVAYTLSLGLGLLYLWNSAGPWLSWRHSGDAYVMALKPTMGTAFPGYC